MRERTIRVIAGLLLGMVALGPGGRAVQADSVLGWGDNGNGQVGDGTTANRNAPVAVIGLSNGVSGITAGHYHSLAIKAGAVWAWGGNYWGQIGDGTSGLGSHRTSPVAISALSSGVTSVAGGQLHSLALKDGGVWAWGYNYHSQLGDGTTTDRNVPVSVTGLSSGVSTIAAGYDHNLALKNGGVWAWGWNDSGQLGDGTITDRNVPVGVTSLSSGVSTITAGGWHSLALKDGGVWAWGHNYYGEIGDGTTTERHIPVAVTGLYSGVSAIAAGDLHGLAVKNGHVWAWGHNGYAQLGDGTATDRSLPVEIDPAHLHDIVAVAAGAYSSYALSADGSLWVWGDNSYGQLGLGDWVTPLSPRHLLPPDGYVFTSVEAGGWHALATLAPVPEPSALLAGAALLAFITMQRGHRRTGSDCAPVSPPRTLGPVEEVQ